MKDLTRRLVERVLEGEMTTREIQGHPKELYQVEISPTLISAVTDAVLEDVRAWQARPLDLVRDQEGDKLNGPVAFARPGLVA